MTSTLTRILLILVVAGGAHLAVLGILTISRKVLRFRISSQMKIQTLTSFTTSVTMFVLYFLAFGFALHELGISLSAYLASASVIGLAVSFGSQGVVQDVIMGLTVVLSDLLDVGDMADVGGQVGIVENIGIRFTEIVNFSGAKIFIPNRTITNVINYPNGYMRVFLDVRLPDNDEVAKQAEAQVRTLAKAAYEQFPGIILLKPTFFECERTTGNYAYIRVKFRIWPGQSSVVETFVKQNIVQAMRQLDPTYAEWMVAVHYRAEPKHKTPERLLPRPAALLQSQDPETEV
jgi:small-conductance mechanosensitive channel